MSLKKKLLILSLSCGLGAFGMIFYESAIANFLGGSDSSYLTFLRWVLALLLLTAVGIPFGAYLFQLSNWIEKIKEDSSLYSDKKRDR